MYGSSTSDADSEEQTGIIVAFAAHDRFAKRNAVVELGLALPLSITEGTRANLNITAVRASVVALHRGRSVAASGRSARALHLRNGSRRNEKNLHEPRATARCILALGEGKRLNARQEHAIGIVRVVVVCNTACTEQQYGQ